MGFYEDFIEKYDSLISWENRARRESNFFKELFLKYKIKTVLDCACGTGQHVIMFNQMGYRSKGSDLSPAMIKKAKINAKKYRVKTTFKIADFRKLSEAFNEKFDAIICIGNSLPHLLTDEDLIKSLNEMYNLLKEKGILIIQQRNYDLLVGKKKRFFPVSIRADEVFFYVLDYFPNKVVFNVVNLELKPVNFKVYSTEYNPLKKAHLNKLIQKSGFKNLRWFGDYKFKKFDINNDGDVIVVCEKASLM